MTGSAAVSVQAQGGVLKSVGSSDAISVQEDAEVEVVLDSRFYL